MSTTDEILDKIKYDIMVVEETGGAILEYISEERTKGFVSGMKRAVEIIEHNMEKED